MSTTPSVMELVRVLTEAFDDMYEGMTRLIALSDKYKKKLEPFNDIGIYDQDSITKMLEELPPNRASALVLALVDMSDIVPDEQSVEKNAELVTDYMETLSRIRANLHEAMGDEK